MKTVVFLDDGEFVSGLDKALQTVVNARDPSGGVPKASERVTFDFINFLYLPDG